MEKPTFSNHAYHFLWVLPLAYVISWPFHFVAAINVCGISGCGGGGFGVSFGPEGVTYAMCAVVGVVAGSAMVAVPWLRPLRVRLAAAIVVAVMVFILLATHYAAARAGAAAG